MHKKLLFILALTVCLLGSTWAQTEIEAVNDHWLREVAADTPYDNDGISVWSTSKGDRRYGVVEFDLSSLGDGPVLGVSLGLYSRLHGYSDQNTPIIQSAYVIPGTIDGMTWNSFMADKDAVKIPLETLGAYDLPAASGDPAQQEAYLYSEASAADIELIKSVKDGDGILSLVLIADESDVYGQSWGDGDASWAGPAPILSFAIPDGCAYNPNPGDGKDLVLADSELSWELYLPFYTEDPSCEVFLTANPDPNFVDLVAGTVSGTTFTPDAALENETTYYWRVVVTDPNNGVEQVYDCNVWTFTTAPFNAPPSNPTPVVGATDVLKETLLTWESDPKAFTHEVYLRKGTDEWQLVAEIDAPDATEYQFTGEWDTGYEWYVIDVFPGGIVVEGDTWNFSVATPSCNGGERLPGDEDGDCYVTLTDLAIMASNWMVCGWVPAESCGQWPPVIEEPDSESITTHLEVWIREVAGDSTYENDAVNLYNSNVPNVVGGTGRRAGMFDFDLSSLQGKTITSARLWVWQIGGWSSIVDPCKTHAFVVDPNATQTASMTWDAYMNEYASTPQETAFEALGVIEVGASVPSQMDTYVGSLPASEVDLALIQNDIDGDGILTISLWADEDETEVYRMDIADDVYGLNRALLEVTSE